jgi:GRIP domain
MADEMRSFQAAKTKAFGSEAQSSRSSLESSSYSDLTAKRKDAASSGVNTIDFVYLKNVLLQFLEQKDKKLQQMLIPVLAQLLHFDGYVTNAAILK